jgi:hypothetical protein
MNLFENLHLAVEANEQVGLCPLDSCLADEGAGNGGDRKQL